MLSDKSPENLKQMINEYLLLAEKYRDSWSRKDFVTLNTLSNSIEDLIEKLSETGTYDEDTENLILQYLRKKMDLEKSRREQNTRNELNKVIDERIALCSENLKAKNPTISQETVTSLCETVNGILKTPDKRDIPEKFDSLLHLWFNDRSITEEIYKTINSKDLCFLHEIIYIFGTNKFVLEQHRQKDNHAMVNLDTTRYYKDQIEKCESKLMAINLTYIWRNQKSGHATMIIIEKGEIGNDGKQLIEVEHFDSSNIDGEIIKDPIENLIKSLFGEEKYTFKFHHQDEVCNPSIQYRHFPSEKYKYQGSCTQFSMLYAFKRLLEPLKPKKLVVMEMNQMFKGKDADQIMIDLIKQFQRLLLSIKTSENDKFKVEVGTRKIMTLSFRQINEELNNKIKIYTNALDDLEDSEEFDRREKEWEDVIIKEKEINDLFIKIKNDYEYFINTDFTDLMSKFEKYKRKHAIYQYFNFQRNGFNQFNNLLKEYEDKLNLCKTSRTKEACDMTDELQIKLGYYANIARLQLHGKPLLIENDIIKDLVAKYESLTKTAGGGRRRRRKTRRRINRRKKSHKKL